MSRLPIPLATLDQHVIALGKTGSGKSSKLRILVEYLLDKEEPGCIIDVKGDWWGLKSSADSKSAGYPVVIFGGKHADVPLNPRAGAALAELIFTGNRPCVIDLKEFRASERTQFFIDFAETVFKVTAGRRWLAIPEVHNFAFKGKVLSPQAGEMLHWANRLASEGRGLGLTILADSQRPQKVHNDFLDSCETLIACRMIHKASRDAVADWIDGCADPEVGKVVLRGLSQMTRPEAWVWSPEVNFGPVKMAFPMFRTYDSFKPQTVNVARLKGWAEVDLAEVSTRLAIVVAEAQANDPKTMRLRISQLEAALAKRPIAPAVAAESPATKAELRTALSTIRQLRQMIGELMKFVVKINAEGFGKDTGVDPAEIQKAIDAAVAKAMGLVGAAAAGRERALKQLQSDAGRMIAAAKKLMADEPLEVTVNVQHQAPYAVNAAPVQRPRTVAAQPIEGAPTGLQKTILNALAWLEAKGIERPSRQTVGAVAGKSAGGGYFSNTVGAMKTAGLIDFPSSGAIALTDTGRSLADLPDTRGEIHEQWLSILSGLERGIVQVLIDAHPEQLSRAQVGERLGKSHEGGYFSNTVGHLRTIGAIDFPANGMLALTRHVMP